jgi:hypothetical protein
MHLRSERRFYVNARVKGGASYLCIVSNSWRRVRSASPEYKSEIWILTRNEKKECFPLIDLSGF